MQIVDALRDRIVMVDHGNGNVTDEPDILCQNAASTIEKLVVALKGMTEFWAYGMAKPPGAKPDAEDEKMVEQLAVAALDALHLADPEYVSKMPRPGGSH